MNFALATLTLLIILYPGFLFRRFYFSGVFSKEYFKQSISDLIFSSIPPGFFLHVAGYLLFIKGKTQVDVLTIGTLLSGTSDPVKVTDAFKSLYADAPAILGYFFGVGMLGILAGYLARIFVRKLKLDRKIKMFRFQNEWHYVFTGEILDFPKILGKTQEIDFYYIDILTNTAEGTVIYTGLLAEYILTKEGGIDRIYLTDARRRFLKDDILHADKRDIIENTAGDDRYYFVPGNLFLTTRS